MILFTKCEGFTLTLRMMALGLDGLSIRISFSAQGADLLLVAQGRVLNGEGHSLGTGHLFPFEPIHLNVVKYFHEMQRIL